MSSNNYSHHREWRIAGLQNLTLSSVAQIINLDANKLLCLNSTHSEIELECRVLTPSQKVFIENTIDSLRLYCEERRK